ncbi:hypothetical protein HL657_05935 [Methanoculleus sp. YWC-01]|jgi:hypothetical protein|uniref:Uncharacterized protein n=1 Tax=Methanoculleus nereidis TaxID=2735141 RepID=A0ABU3Z1M2_9EURY|nr:hypothetical protein [Methanoculleus sp. YWC-01]MCK9299046.1 hypothetical protein [Methanoculleus sp.]MDV4342718.1 hypothetical protein [Methanoculleus sp. YWC-01]PKL56520.1 MAG: hypothetical protein CVV35_04410 [Methanomicrobiales archaeon HGW-Methanomicrobiales-6]
MKLPYGSRLGKDREAEVPVVSPNEFSQRVAYSRTEAKKILNAAENDLATLAGMKWSLEYTLPILGAAILINLGLLLARTGEYYLYWIMASFIFLMINPFLLLLPTDAGDLKSYIRYFNDLKNRERKSLEEIISWESLEKSAAVPADAIEALKRLTQQRNSLYELGWNLFFINCQPLAPGFLVLFALSSVFALAGWLVSGEFGPYSTAIVVIQSAAIIVFYVAIVYVQPYSRGFFAGILGMQSRIKERYNEAWTQGLKYALTAAVVTTVAGVIFIAAIVLPGVTYNSFTSAEADIELRAGMFALIFLTQMIVVRHLQGGYSRTLVYSLLSSRIETIREEVLSVVADLASVSLRNGVTPRMAEDLERITLDLTRCRALKIDYASLFGYFPVCMVTPDVGAIMRVAETVDGSRGRTRVDEAAA